MKIQQFGMKHTFKAIESVDHSITPPPTVSFGKQWFSMLVFAMYWCILFRHPMANGEAQKRAAR